MRRLFLGSLWLLVLAAGLAQAGRPPAPLPAGKWPPRTYCVYYGPWDDRKLAQAHDFDLLVFHPGPTLQNLTPEQAAKLRVGRDGQPNTADDVLLIAYISIGESEDVPRGPAGAAAPGDGPVRFDADKGLLPTHQAYPTWFLDERRYHFNAQGFYDWRADGLPRLEPGQDGLPDMNGKWNSFFVNVGDPGWHQFVLDRARRIDVKLQPDGFFLDTLDTASPWGDYPWLAKDMALLVQKLRQQLPTKLLIGNRGLFLFEKYADLMRPSLNGVMFESFISEWDWYRHVGADHAWLGGNVHALDHFVVPEAARPDGFHLFFLNYLNPGQPEFYNLLFAQAALLRDVPYTHYVSTPDLQKLHPPPATYLHAEAPAKLPVWSEFTVTEQGAGRVQAEWTLELTAADEPTLGRELFLDWRWTEQTDLPTDRYPLARRVPLVYDQLERKRVGDRLQVRATAYGLVPGRRYVFFAGVLGRAPERQAPVRRIELTLAAAPDCPPPVTDLQGEGREGGVFASWKIPTPAPARYNVYLGPNPWQLTAREPVTTAEVLLTGLANRRPVYLSVAPVNAAGQEGCRAWPVLLVPKDCTPPPAPTELAIVPSLKHEVFVKWQAVKCEDLGGYRVYCFPAGRALRYPVQVDAGSNQTLLPGLSAGVEYRIFVTAADWENNESQPAEVKTFTAR